MMSKKLGKFGHLMRDLKAPSMMKDRKRSRSMRDLGKDLGGKIGALFQFSMEGR